MTEVRLRALKQTIAMIGLCVGLGVITTSLLMMLEQQRPAATRAAELSYLPKGDYLKVAVLGYRQIAADLIWLRAIQHFGGRDATLADYRWAYHAADVLTDLDPRFVMAYQATGTILGVWAGLVQESIALLKKGAIHNPDVWQLPFTIGYDYFYELCDPANAAVYFRQASLLPGAPEYLPRLAARMTVESGDPDAALEFLQRFSQQTNDERMREALAQRMKEVLAERDIRLLEEAVRRYQQRYRKLPTALSDLVAGHMIDRVPQDPFGNSYQLNATNGTVTSPGLKERLRVHRHVACASATRGMSEPSSLSAVGRDGTSARRS
jgi:tetratricopeptide (TPR) repeat protein